MSASTTVYYKEGDLTNKSLFYDNESETMNHENRQKYILIYVTLLR